jgi:ParB family chromosome partitioning protein
MAKEKKGLGKGLGKGLDAFFANDVDVLDNVIENKKEKDNNEIEKVVELNIVDVEPMKDQPRKIFDEEKLEELSNSIKEHGVIQPILVVKNEDGYAIVAGERRWRAAKKAGLKKIPAIVKEYNETKKKQVALIENIQREDLNIVEVARAIKELMEIENCSQTEVAKITGKNVSTISNIVRLLKLPDEILGYILDGELVEGQARALLALDSKKRQLEIAKKAIEKKLTVRDVEKLVYGSEEYVRKPEKQQPKSVYYKNLENKLKDYFGYKVKLDYTKSHQKLIIEYDDKEGLENLLNKFNIDI